MTSQKEQLSYLLKSDKDLEELISSIPKIVPFKREKGFTTLLLRGFQRNRPCTYNYDLYPCYQFSYIFTC